jgi:glutamate-1-semialdehyde 2,1-aminomutase
MTTLKIVAIVQARMGSTRLPNKVMKPIGEMPMIELLLARLARATEVDEIVVATSEDSRNQPLADHVVALGYRCWRGSENDALDRYLQAAKAAAADVVVRITGDCPLVDAALVDEMILHFKAAGVDYFSNTAPPSYPDGLDIEVFTFAALERAALETDKAFDREHVTPYLH